VKLRKIADEAAVRWHVFWWVRHAKRLRRRGFVIPQQGPVGRAGYWYLAAGMDRGAAVSETAERWADEIIAAVQVRAADSAALALSLRSMRLKGTQQEAFDLGVTCGFLATLHELVARGLLPKEKP